MTRGLLGVGVLLGLVLVDRLGTMPVLAQITAAPDGTGTEVRRNGDRVTIQGGTLSRDQQNLFHSFERFGLSASEVATFLSNPQIQNILGRVTGGDASVINGLLQVTGGHSNLYLMNPAGILFGPNARLDIPGSFTATTATGIGFGGSRFNAISPSDYVNLVGTPNEFIFATSAPGAIANLGNLAVNTGESLTLLGGTVVNTGTLTAPGGQITIAAIPGQNAVRVSQDGLLLSLELQGLGQAAAQELTPLPFTPLTLAQLLTGGNLDNVNALAVNPDGSVTLTSGNITLPNAPGTAIASGTLTTASSTPNTQHPIPEINVLGDRVALLSATLDASGIDGGGTVRVGGDYQGQGRVFNSSRTYVSRDSAISANALDSGDGGRIMVWGDDVTRFYGTLSASGEGSTGNGGFAEISGAHFLDFDGLVNLTSLQGQPGTLLLDPADINIVAGGINLPDLPSSGGTQLLFGDNPGGTSIVNNGTINAAVANVVLQATNTITFSAPINITAANVGLTAQANSDITVNADIVTDGGNITLISGGNITTTGSLFSNSLNLNLSAANPGIAGNITLTSTGAGNINTTAGRLDATSSDSAAGDITLTTQGGSISTSDLTARTFGGFGDGGDITLTTTDAGSIDTSASTFRLDTFSANARGGNIVMTGGNITTGRLFSNFANPRGGNFALTGNEINFVAGNNSIQSSGTLLLQPLTGNQAIALGGATDSGAGALDLLNTDLTTLTDGFSSITIGRADGSGAVTLGGNVAFNDPVTLQAPVGTGSFNAAGFGLTSANGITIQAGDGITTGAITATGDITLSVPNGTAGVNINGPIASNGGNIVATGRSTQGGGGLPGILVGNTVNSGTGSITFTGTNTNGEDGIRVNSTISSTSGNIQLNGSCTGTCSLAEGIILLGGNVLSTSGNISLEGKSTTDEGIQIIFGGSINSGSGAVTLTADRMNLVDVGGGTLGGNGNLLLQPLAPSSGLILGGTGNPFDTFLTTSELQTLQNGFASITIGRADGSGALTLAGDVTFNDPVTLRAPSGSINTTGGTITGGDNATIAIQAGGTITTGNIANPSRAIAITSTGGAVNTTAGIINSGYVPETTNPGIVSPTGGDIAISGNSLNLGAISSSIRVGGGQSSGNILLQAANGNINATTINTNAFSFFGAIGNAGTLTVRAPAGNVTITGAITTESISVGAGDRAGNAGAIDISSSTGTVSLTGGVSSRAIAQGSFSTAGNSNNITISGSTINLGNTLDSGALFLGGTAGQSGNISLTGNVGLSQAIATLSSGTGTTTVTGTINGTTAGANSLSVNAANATFNGAIGSAISLGNITLNSSGTTQLNGAVNATSLTTDAGGSTTLNGNVTTTGAAGQTYNDTVTTANNAILTANEINFAAPVLGTGTLTLRPFTSSQAIAIAGAVDTGTTTLDLLAGELNNIQSGFSSVLIGQPNSTNTVILDSGTLNRPVTVAGGSTLIGPNQTTTWAITGQGVGSVPGSGLPVTFSNIETLIGGSGDDTFAFSNGATFAGAIAGGGGTNTIDYSATANNLTWILDGTNQGAIGSTDFSNIQNLTNGSGNDTVIFNADASLTGNIIGGSGNLTLRGDDIEFGGTVSGTEDLLIQPNTVSQRIRIGGTVNFPDTLNLSTAEIAQLQDGFASIIIGRLNGTGETIVNAVSFTDPTTIRNESISVNGAIAGLNDASLRFIGETTLNANLTTDNQSIFFNNATRIGDNADAEETDITLNTGNSTGDIIFGSTVNGLSANDNSLTLQTAGLVRFAEAVGDDVPLGRLAVTAQSTEVGGNINASNIAFNSPVTLLDSAVISASQGILNVNDSLTADDNNLTLSAGEINLLGGENSVSGSGRLTLRQSNVGQAIEIGNVLIPNDAALNLTTADLAALADGFSGITIEQFEGNGDIILDTSVFRDPLTLRTASGFIFYDDDVTLPSDTSITIDSAQPIVLRRNITTQGNSLIFNNDVELRGDITLDTSAAGNAIVFAGAVNGDRPLTLRAGLGSIRLRGIVGGTTPLASLRLESADAAEFRANVTTRGDIQFNVPVSIFNNAEINAGRGAIAATQLITGAENSSVTFSANGPIDVQDITAGGGLSLRSGSALMARNLAAQQAIALTSNSTLRTGTITSEGGNITLEGSNINLAGNVTSGGGDISLASRDAVITQALNSSSPTQGGAITVRATNSITTGQINSSSVNGNGGNVLLDPLGDIQVEAIDARGGSNGRGGNVAIIAGQYFRAISTIPELASPTSISTAGGQGGGNIFIRHGGGGDVPFVVGANTLNGTLGAITTGSDTISPVQTYFGDVTLGGIQITTNGTNCILQCPPPPPPPPPPPLPEVTFPETQSTLRRVLEQTGVQPALIYVGFVPAQNSIDIGFEQREASSTQDIEQYLGRSGSSENLAVTFQAKGSDRLEIVIVTSSGNPIRHQVEGVTRSDIQRVTRQLLGQITDRSRENSTAYLQPAQQLYRWLIAPIEADLQRQKIENLSFIMDAGLRFVPIAALHDGQQFLVEKYSVGLMPSLALTDTRRVDLRNAQVLAMGASQFTNNLPLPAVPVELTEINTIWQGESFLNTNFTPENLKLQREQRPFGIVHLATHAEFNRGAPENSYIQFWNEKLGFDQIRQLGLNNPPVELLVLSACRTALGNEDAELGFAGFAVQAGVRSVLASLWSVSDIGTLALMSEFYEQLRIAPTRSEALRRAQIAMLKGQVTIRDRHLFTSSGRQVDLPPELLSQADVNLPYPLYWAAFTMIGNPW